MSGYDLFLKAIKLISLVTIWWFTNDTLSRKHKSDKWQKYSLWYLLIFYGLWTIIFFLFFLMMVWLMFVGFDIIVTLVGLLFLLGTFMMGYNFYKFLNLLKKQK